MATPGFPILLPNHLSVVSYLANHSSSFSAPHRCHFFRVAISVPPRLSPRSSQATCTVITCLRVGHAPPQLNPDHWRQMCFIHLCSPCTLQVPTSSINVFYRIIIYWGTFYNQSNLRHTKMKKKPFVFKEVSWGDRGIQQLTLKPSTSLRVNSGLRTTNYEHTEGFGPWPFLICFVFWFRMPMLEC